MKEILAEIRSIITEYKLERKYRAQLLKAQLNVDAFEYFLKRSVVTGVEIEMDFGDGKKVTIRPEKLAQTEYKSFRDKYKEERIKNA